MTVQPGVSIPAHLLEGPVPGGYITGYVFDADGKPVPGATVTLWQNGQVWQRGNYVYVPSDNPQTTNIAYNNEGSFLFGFTYPGEYTLTAEKDGYNGSSDINRIGNETLCPNQLESTTHPVMVNITLSGYRVPVLTPEQQSFTGAITGNLMTASGVLVTGVNMSLWQNGSLVDIPDNPQSSFKRNYSGAIVDYLFEHLAPGRYMVMAEYSAGDEYNDTVYVDVKNSTMRVDISLSHALNRPYNFPINSFTPTVCEFVSSDQNATALPANTQVSEAKASPAISCMVAALVIGFVGYFLYDKSNRL